MGQYQSAVRDLAAGQKSARGVSFYSRWVNRPAGRRLAAASHVLGLTPNQVSLISAAVTGAGICVIAMVPPSWAAGAVIALLLVLGFMLDAADGQLARLRGTSSLAGEWLDHFLDAAKMVAVHGAVLIGWYRYFDVPHALLLVPLAFQLAAVCTFSGGTIAALLRRTPAAAPAPPAAPSNLRAVLLLPADYGMLCLAFLLYGSQGLFVPAYAALGAIHWAFLALFTVKWFKELRQL